MQRIPEDNIGFAVVKRRFESSGRVFLAGEELDRSFLLRMPRGNRDAMSDSKQIEIYPRAVGRGSAPVATKGEMHLRASGIGTYDVIQGEVVGVNLSKEDAQAMIDAHNDSPREAETSKADAPKKKRASAGARRKPKKAKRVAKRKAAPKATSREAPAMRDEPTSNETNGPIL